jgi:hypothetical protein
MLTIQQVIGYFIGHFIGHFIGYFRRPSSGSSSIWFIALSQQLFATDI